MHDFTYPKNPLFLSIWQAYFKLLRGIGSRFYLEWQTVFYELPAFIKQSRWIAEALCLLKENAFSDITSESLTFGTAGIITARKPQALP